MDGPNYFVTRVGHWRLVISLLSLLICGSTAFAQYPQQRVVERLREFEAGLQADPATVAVWEKYLGLEDLRTELARGDAANVEHVAAIGKRLNGLEIRIDDEELSSMRQAVAGWLENPGDRGAGTTAQRALRTLQTWTRRNRSRASGWDDFLELDRLNVELRKGDQADLDWAKESLMVRLQAASTFESSDRFLNLQRALAHWSEELERQLQDPLAISVRRAKQDFIPLTPEQYQQALDQMRAELNTLDQFLRSGGAEKEQGWKKYLLWDELQAEMRESDRPRFTVLEKTLARLGGDTSGPDRHPFVRIQRRLRGFLGTLRAAESDSARLAAQRDQLRRQVENLERFLARGGAQKEADWKRYLRWDDWHDAIYRDELDPRSLARVATLLQADEVGLNKRPFRQLDLAIGKYLELQRLQEQFSADDEYLRRLEMLARAMEQRQQPDPAIQANIRSHLEWLRESGQAAGLVSHIESTRRQPNLRMQVSESLLVRQVDDIVNQRSPVGRWFEGAWVRGTADTHALVTGELIPSDNQVALDIVLRGNILTNSVATQRRVQVYSRGNTYTEGRKRIYFDESGLRAEPAYAMSSTSQQINAVQVNRRVGKRVITRAATRRAYEKKPRAERVANGDASQAIQQNMDQQAQDMVQKVNQTLETRLVTPLRNNYLYPEQLLMWSTDAHVLIQGLLVPGDSLGPDGGMPPLPSGSDVAVVAHQSAVNNVLAEYLGDVTINSDQMQAVMERYNLPGANASNSPPAESSPPDSGSEDAATAEAATAEVATNEEESADDLDEPWSITFDHLQPATVQFDEQQVTIAVVGNRFTRGADDIQERIRIRASYRVEMAGADVDLVRMGEVEIDFLDVVGQLSSEQLAYKTFLRNRTEPLFRERMSTRDLPDNEAAARLKAFALKSLGMDDGWISLGLNVDTTRLQGLGLK